jgi:hypothetical protein
MLTFIIGHCCYLQSSRFLRVCNVSSISAATGSTTGTDCLELCVGQSMIVPEFQRHPGNDTLAAISLSETRRNHKGPNRVSREGGGATATYLLAKICCTC